MRKFAITGIIFFVVIFSFCHQPSYQPNTKLKILTTIAPLYCFTINITGELADVKNLLPAGAGPHEYSFSPADIKKIEEAQILIKNDVNLESWLDKLISSVRKNLTIIDTSLGTEIINKDPHIWLSPMNAIIQVKNIRNTLIKADPANGEQYTDNADKYIRRLETLDKDMRNEIKTWERREFIAFHSAFLYLARHYGLNQVAVIKEFPEKVPTPKHIADVINTIKTSGIKAIFSEPQVSHKIVKTIAKDLNLQVFSLDTLETGNPYPEWYEDRMRSNLSVLKKALN